MTREMQAILAARLLMSAYKTSGPSGAIETNTKGFTELTPRGIKKSKNASGCYYAKSGATENRSNFKPYHNDKRGNHSFPVRRELR
jgi:hypothetical protein